MDTGSGRTTEASTQLGERIRRLRQSVDGATMDSVAALARIDPANYGDIERGHGNPTLETLLRIASVLEVSASELVEGLTRADLPDDPPDVTVAAYITWAAENRKGRSTPAPEVRRAGCTSSIGRDGSRGRD